MKKESARTMSELIDLFVREQGLAEGLQRVRIFQAWDDVVGERGARATLGKFYRDGVLYCTLSSSILRNQLYFQREALAVKINEKLAAPLIKEIVLK